jgi:hypothetical protein
MSLIGSLAIAVSVPKEILTLEWGVIQAIEALCTKFGISRAAQWIEWSMSLEVLGWSIAWVAGPAPECSPRPRRVTCRHDYDWASGHDHPIFTHLFTDPLRENGFWTLIAITTQTMLIMHVLTFAAAIILRSKYPDVKRTYTVPLGNSAMIAMVVTESIVCAICYVIGLLSPEEIDCESKDVGNIAVMLPSFIAPASGGRVAKNNAPLRANITKFL